MRFGSKKIFVQSVLGFTFFPFFDKDGRVCEQRIASDRRLDAAGKGSSGFSSQVSFFVLLVYGGRKECVLKDEPR